MTTQASVLDKIVHEWHMSQTEMQLLSGKWVCFYLSNDLHSFTTRLSPQLSCREEKVMKCCLSSGVHEGWMWVMTWRTDQ